MVEAQSLVALDTDHIKDYVFATDTLKEIRGASSLLDRLNRDEMQKIATSLGGEKIYANGGSGLFLIDSKKAVEFGVEVQQRYRQMTAGGASITYIVQPLPEEAPDAIDEIMKYPMPNTLALLRHRLRQQKDNPRTYTTEASHPLMRHCDSCGVFYAVEFVTKDQNFYCQSCLNKQNEDGKVKDYITTRIGKSEPLEKFKSPLWNEIFKRLKDYHLPFGTERPKDLNVFREFRQAKDYLGLIYADANGMGRKLDELSTLQAIKDFANKIDNAVYDAMCEVINTHLPTKESKDGSVFPFDILLIGGDDLVLVTPAAQAMAVVHTLAERFYTLANEEKLQDHISSAAQQVDTPQTEKNSLSVGVVLAPTNYPFSLLLNLVDNTLKFAKKDGSKTFKKKKSNYGKTRINFLVVSGNTSQSFDTVYKQLYQRKENKSSSSFYATMRPYTLEGFQFLLTMLREGRSQFNLGRSKLHQLREAVLQLNLSTSVTESLAVLRSWKETERNFVVTQVYRTERMYPLAQWDEQNPAANFPVVTFPWLIDNQEKNAKRYSTLLLDFVELYDFVAGEDGTEYDKN